jgi:hypothetical protein
MVEVDFLNFNTMPQIFDNIVFKLFFDQVWSQEKTKKGV